METINPELIEQLYEILAKAKQNGGMFVVGANQCGKTTAVMWLTRLIMKSEEYKQNKAQLKMFDTCVNWRYKFDACPYIEYGDERAKIIPAEQTMILDMIDPDPQGIKRSIAEILQGDFEHKRQLKEKFQGVNQYTNYYVIEEIQNIFGRMGLQGQSGRYLRRIFSEGSNFGMCIIGVGQRLADIDTAIVERRKYFLFGRTNGENDLKKIKAMFGDQVVSAIKGCAVGEFIFHDREKMIIAKIAFPEWHQNGTPTLKVVDRKKEGSFQILYKGVE
jgi:energy-coupling factor transporter ATP-binding protein EcfA2